MDTGSSTSPTSRAKALAGWCARCGGQSEDFTLHAVGSQTWATTVLNGDVFRLSCPNVRPRVELQTRRGVTATASKTAGQ